jgi:hypothetical protein
MREEIQVRMRPDPRMIGSPEAPSHSIRRAGSAILAEKPQGPPGMSVRPPQNFSYRHSVASGMSALEYELLAERANALGRHGRKVELALAELKAWDPARRSAEQRDDLLYEAADAVWALFIQREICGLRNSADVIQRYGIPKEVLARLGVVRRPAKASETR